MKAGGVSGKLAYEFVIVGESRVISDASIVGHVADDASVGPATLLLAPSSRRHIHLRNIVQVIGNLDSMVEPG